MKRIDELETYSLEVADDYDGFRPDLWKKDYLVQKLEEAGHQVLWVDRSVLIIEKCEENDDFPKGWSNSPLKITIFGDPDIGGYKTEIFLHCGRYGLMETVYRNENGHETTSFRIDKQLSDKMSDDNLKYLALHDFIEQNIVKRGAGYWAKVTIDQGEGFKPIQGKKFKKIPEIEDSIKKIQIELEKIDSLIKKDIADNKNKV